ncbi:MAG: DUF455 family protein, partial [Verrucomicrobiota bacterium]
MEIRDFAERVLFANTLEEKLGKPDSPIVDLHPGRPLSHDTTPGRPSSLQFGKGSTPPLPAEHQLRSEEERAILLHFFANHELLATELMALALLRFPEAPTDFRQGLYRTLREEQRHTRWYVKRLGECGLSFGDLPVNHYFWKAVSTMEQPLDYVSRLSLTFEQANLDYSFHYAGLLERSGDPKSATILQQIYRDEIRHVQYGLHWFRRWKPPHLSDWHAYSERLSFPLSPSRAKANGNAPFNEEARLTAGLTPSFVE